MKWKFFKLQFRIFLILISSFSVSCSKDGKDSGSGGLSPARNIQGLWSTPIAVNVYETSDGCDTYARYNRTPVKMTFNITAIDDNNVDITISFTFIGSTVQLASNCGLSAGNSIFFISEQMHGKISSSHLQLLRNQMQYNSAGGAIGLALVEVGSFNFTTNNLTGTITEKDCPAYCAGWETDANTCILTR